MEIFKPGDKYIHFTKYGGVNKGEVDDVHSTTVWDTKNLCRYVSISIFTTKGVRLNLDGTDGRIYKVESEMEYEKARSLDRALKIASSKKFRPSNKQIHNFDENKKT